MALSAAHTPPINRQSEEKANTMDEWDRRGLWGRLESVDYFDWCDEEQRARLQALYFEGTVEEPAPDYVRVRQLFWSPHQGPAAWQQAIDQCMRYTDDEGVEHTSGSAGAEFIAKSVDSLLLRDYQYAGMGVAQQQELLDFLGLEHRPAPDSHYLYWWLVNVRNWLESIQRDPHDAGAFDECVFAASWSSVFYRLLDASPLSLRGKWIAVDETAGPWPHNPDRFTRQLTQDLRDLMAMALRGKVPQRPNVARQPRVDFLQRFRHDLEQGTAPRLLLDLWAPLPKPAGK